MPNGKLHKKPPKRLSNYKKAVKLEEGLTVARLKGELRYKKTRKGLEHSAREHLGKLIDRVEPVKAMAFGATVAVVYAVLKKAPEIQETISALSIGMIGAGAIMTVVLGTVFPPAAIIGLAGVSAGIATAITQQKAGEILPKEEWFLIALSIAIAWLLVEHGGAIIGLGEAGIVKFAGILLAGMTV